MTGVQTCALPIWENDWFNEDGTSKPVFMEMLQAFQAGKGAMIWGLASDICHWKDFSDALGKDAVGFFPNINHPDAPLEDRMNGGGAGIGWAIMSWSDYKDEAHEYAKFYVTGEGARILVEDLGAIVPNVQADFSTLGYPALNEVLEYMNTNGTISMSDMMGQQVNTALQAQMELFYNAEEIDLDTYIENIQDALEEDREMR